MVNSILTRCQVWWKASRRSCSYIPMSPSSSSSSSSFRGLFADLGLGDDGWEMSIFRRARKVVGEEAEAEAPAAGLWRTKNGCKKTGL